jgi:hypothetical protein
MDIKTQAISSKAHFSECQKYRYTLVRKFRAGQGLINFVMLNPSTANEEFNDPTVARCENMALRLGYGTMAVTNIFAYRATDPTMMKQMQECAIGDENNRAISDTAKDAALVVCAWGNHGLFLNRGDDVLKLLRAQKVKTHALKLNGNGQPAHPLYLRKDLVPFEM